MGSWGIKAFDSEIGLDTLEFIRTHIPKNGCIILKELLEQIRLDAWCMPPDVEKGESHTSIMMIAELMESFQNGNIEEWEYIPKKPFKKIVSFIADRESVLQMHEYLFGILQQARKNAENGNRWNGWCEERNWESWQTHMENLLENLQDILYRNEAEVELVLQAENEISDIPIEMDMRMD